VALCNSGLGQFGEAFSTGVNADSNSAATLHSLGTWLMWLGILGGLAAAFRLWQVYRAIPEARAHFDQQADQAKAPEA